MVKITAWLTYIVNDDGLVGEAETKVRIYWHVRARLGLHVVKLGRHSCVRPRCSLAGAGQKIVVGGYRIRAKEWNGPTARERRR